MSNPSNLAILGGGGHSAVIADWADVTRKYERIVRFDDALGQGQTVSDMFALDPLGWAVVIGIGDNTARLARADQFDHQGFTFGTVIHPSAIIGGGVEIGAGGVVAPGTVINCEASIGKHCIVNTGASVDHHCHIADGVHLGPGVRLAGNVKIGRGSFVGIGAVVVPGVTMDAETTIGAGAVVVDDIPLGKTVKGVPAR